MSISDSWNYLLSLGVQHHAWDDPFFQEGLHVCSPLQKVPCIDLDDEELLHSKMGVIKCSASGCNKTFETVADHAAHHRACHNYSCSTCKQSFPSHHLLDLHLLEIHDSLFQLMAERKPMYQCLLETCCEKFSNAAERKKHCMAKHKFPADFRFDLTWRKLGQKKKGTRKGNQNEEMECEEEVMDDIADDNSNQTIPEMIMTDDVNNTDNLNQVLRKPRHKVPNQVSFGIGVPRGFHRKKRGSSSHWHQRSRPHGVTKTNIEEVNMKDLENSLIPCEGKL